VTPRSFRVRARQLLFTLVLVALAAAPAAGQGRGNGLTKRGGKTPAAPAPAVTEQQPLIDDAGVPLTGSGLRQFGSWLDDASLMGEGDAWTALSFAHVRSTGGRQTDFPVADVSYGLSPRAQLGLSVPYYRVRFADGTAVGGIGDVYLTAKLALVTPEADRTWGVSVTPIVEVLDDPAPGSSRFGVGVPLNAEVRFAGARLYGSTGFFTRGTLFTSAALEFALSDRLMMTGAIAAMRAINDDDVADALELPTARADGSVVAAWFLRPGVAVFGGVGRSLSNASTVGATFLFTGGVSFSYSAAPASPRSPGRPAR
jgi:hypothetical protein